MKKHLRVVAEIAILGTVAMSVPMFAMFPLIAVLNFFGGWGINLPPLDVLGIGIVYAFPLIVAFYYGYRRKLQLGFLAVTVGWIVGSYGSGALISVTIFRHAKVPAGKPLTPWPWANWSIWLALMLLPNLVMALLTMWGQRVRLKRSR